MGDTVLFLLILIPFVGALLAWVLGKRIPAWSAAQPEMGKQNKERGEKRPGLPIRGAENISPMMLCACILTAAEAVSFAVLFGILAASGDGAKAVWSFSWEGFCGLGLHLCMDGFRALYCLVASFMWLMTMLFTGEYMKEYHNRERYVFFNLFTLGATVGVFLSADLYTAFIFFEIMSFTSYTWVAQEETPGALRAAQTYLAVAVIGGLVMLMGLFLLYYELGTLEIGALAAAAGNVEGLDAAAMEARYHRIFAGAACLLFGYGAKAGVFPLHIWLPKAHPVAPAPASALLSGILTKAGVFGVLVISCQLLYGDGAWGTLILVLGVLTMFTGALLALFSVDLKRTLACSSVSQIGFILVGIGMQGLLAQGAGPGGVLSGAAAMGTSGMAAANAALAEPAAGAALSEATAAAGMAIRGALLHMVNHSLIKLVLFMAAGVVFMNLHELNLNKIRGFGRGKKLLNLCFLMGALGIGGIPLWNGYISKTLLHESIVEYRELLREGAVLQTSMFTGAAGMAAIEWIFLISGGMTVAYMLKLYLCLFVEKNSDSALQEKYDGMKNYMNPVSCFALAGSAVLLPLLGMLPHPVTDRLADLSAGFLNAAGEAHRVAYFSSGNLKGAVISLLIGALLYLVLVRGALMENGDEARGAVCEGDGGRKSWFGSGRVYADRWPVWLDLENLIYRPLLLKVLPVLFGSLCRICDRLVDSIVVLLRKTIYRDSKIPHELEEGTPLTHALGSILDGVTGYFNHPDATQEELAEEAYARQYDEGRFEHKLAVLHDDLMENSTIIGRSLSFGLFLASLGLLLTLVYMLVG